MTPLLELKDIRRSYPAGDEQVEVLKGISLDIYAGEMVAIVGASGSGKSTLMNILGCLDKATSGTYRVAGQDVATLDADALAQLRREHFGFISALPFAAFNRRAERHEVPPHAGLEETAAASRPGVTATTGAGRPYRVLPGTAFGGYNSASVSRGH